ncbi:hypothetical protein ABFV05_016699 [Capra hircus]
MSRGAGEWPYSRVRLCGSCPRCSTSSQGRGREFGLRQGAQRGSAGSGETAVPAAALPRALSSRTPGRCPRFRCRLGLPSSEKGACHTHAGFNKSQAGHTHRPPACRAVVQQHGNATAWARASPGSTARVEQGPSTLGASTVSRPPLHPPVSPAFQTRRRRRDEATRSPGRTLSRAVAESQGSKRPQRPARLLRRTPEQALKSQLGAQIAMEEQRPTKRFHLMATDQGARRYVARCPGGRGGDPGGPAGPARPSRPLAYVKPVRCEAAGFVGGATQRGRSRRRGGGHRAGREPRAPGNAPVEQGPRQPPEPDVGQTVALAPSRAARQELRDAYGHWGLREVRPAHCAYVGFVPAGSAVIMLQTQAGVHLYAVPGAQAQSRQPPSL